MKDLGRMGKPFLFRGLKFRGYPGGIGYQVYDPEKRKWFDVAILSRRSFELVYAHVPDIAKWSGAMCLGTVRFCG